MPQHKSTKKRMRTSARQQARNRMVKSHVRKAIRAVREAPADGMQESLRHTTSVLDNAVRKGVIKKRTANRQKSRLARAVNRNVAASSA